MGNSMADQEGWWNQEAHFLLFIFLSISLIGQTLKEKNQKTIKLIISLNSFHNVKTQDAQAIAQILASHLKKTHNLDYDFLVETPESISDIEKSASNDFDFITTNEPERLIKLLKQTD